MLRRRTDLKRRRELTAIGASITRVLDRRDWRISTLHTVGLLSFWWAARGGNTGVCVVRGSLRGACCKGRGSSCSHVCFLYLRVFLPKVVLLPEVLFRKRRRGCGRAPRRSSSRKLLSWGRRRRLASSLMWQHSVLFLMLRNLEPGVLLLTRSAAGTAEATRQSPVTCWCGMNREWSAVSLRLYFGVWAVFPSQLAASCHGCQNTYAYVRLVLRRDDVAATVLAWNRYLQMSLKSTVLGKLS